MRTLHKELMIFGITFYSQDFLYETLIRVMPFILVNTSMLEREITE